MCIRKIFCFLQKDGKVILMNSSLVDQPCSLILVQLVFRYCNINQRSMTTLRKAAEAQILSLEWEQHVCWPAARWTPTEEKGRSLTLATPGSSQPEGCTNRFKCRLAESCACTTHNPPRVLRAQLLNAL